MPRLLASAYGPTTGIHTSDVCAPVARRLEEDRTLMRLLRLGAPGAERPPVLEVGEVVNTGTPAGVAPGRPDHPCLRPGQSVELEIRRPGRQRRPHRQAEA